ncbi:hypothetical protein DOZ80_15545 [Pseudomonas fluorescens]|uniref:Lipoprotein n=1 Tax=Pseudomonas fluorescens TaxID=294 RepID=A0A327N375_PSEFL|nr:hypothetical protein [Pseudomonas fluorescens]RAI69541.1 hypothetical protein DOZ80_15545 [Pseudomonas fluorescens]
MEGARNEVTDWTRSTTTSLKLGLSLSVVFLISACGTRPVHFTPPNRADPIIEVSEVKLESTENIIAGIEDKDKAKRNAAQFKLLAQSDIYCGDFISSIYGRRAVTNVWYSTITTATAAAAAIVGGRAAQNLAGTSAVTNEMRGSINNEMYGGELIPTVAKEIITMRKAELNRILQQQNKEMQDYSGAAAIADVIGYHELCSIPIAISNILARANSRTGAGKLDLNASLQMIDKAIEVEKARLNDKTIEPNAGEKLRIRNKISELSDRRSNLIQIYAVPGYQSSTDEGLNSTSDGATQTHVNE